MVVTLVDVVSNCVLNISGCYVVQVALEPVHEPSLGLAYILCGAVLAGDAVT